MLQYLVILLDNTSTSYCQYENNGSKSKLISIDDLKAGIFYGMKDNLMISFVYPDYELPKEYKEIINTIDHGNIISSRCEDNSLQENADIVVFNNWDDMQSFSIENRGIYVLRTNKADLFVRYKSLDNIIKTSQRLNIVVTDIDSFTESDFGKYKEVLYYLITVLKDCYSEGKSPQLNLLTDRIILDNMNNCDAGIGNITLAPNGNFYVCPAFYYAGICNNDEKTLNDECRKGYAIGSLFEGVDIKNPQLYRLDHAPLCRTCDAYQCKRCVWLNRKTTLEINTPSHEQCVVAHLERNASRHLLKDVRTLGSFLPDKEIKEIDYLDPFDIKGEW